ncbi:MAG: SDR family oxidoreductase [Geminicoccaceae bacterium]
MTAWPERFGPWALVTGASDGIGRAIARDLARRGLSLVLVARRRERLEALADELRREFRVAVRVHPADLGERAAVAGLLDAVGDLEIGLLASCAGFGSSGPFLATDPAAELAMVEVNCTASLHLARVLGTTMAGRGRGGILLMSSIVAFQGVPHAATYAATKAFVQSLAEGIAPELEGRGVAVLASAPGPVASGFGARAGMRLERGARPETVARATLDALGRRRLVRPGGLARLLGWSVLTLPRPLRTRIMGRIMQRMTAADDGSRSRQAS